MRKRRVWRQNPRFLQQISNGKSELCGGSTKLGPFTLSGRGQRSRTSRRGRVDEFVESSSAIRREPIRNSSRAQRGFVGSCGVGRAFLLRLQRCICVRLSVSRSRWLRCSIGRQCIAMQQAMTSQHHSRRNFSINIIIVRHIPHSQHQQEHSPRSGGGGSSSSCSIKISHLVLMISHFPRPRAFSPKLLHTACSLALICPKQTRWYLNRHLRMQRRHQSHQQALSRSHRPIAL